MSFHLVGNQKKCVINWYREHRWDLLKTTNIQPQVYFSGPWKYKEGQDTVPVTKEVTTQCGKRITEANSEAV